MDRNDILGVNVLHKNLGAGKIKDYTGDYVFVDFGNNKISQFVFPDIFLGDSPLLKTDNTIINEFIAKQKAGHTCIRCGKHIDIANKRNLCYECIQRLRKCDFCGKMVDVSETASEYGGYQKTITYCKKCYRASHTKCVLCGEYWGNDELNRSPYVMNNAPFCEFCNGSFYRCSVCNTYLEERFATITDDHDILCPDCKVDHIVNCAKCGITTLKDETNLCSKCNLKKEYVGYIKVLKPLSLSVEEYSLYQFFNQNPKIIMSRLRKHQPTYVGNDNLKPAFDVLIIEDYGKRFVVINYLPDKYKWLVDDDITLSKLKRSDFFFVYLLDRELLSNIQTESGERIKLFASPYRLRVQTVYDTDYRKEWVNGYLVYDGNNYGDTTSYYIIGYLE